MINEKASLVQIPSGYKSGTLYSVVPNTSAGDFTIDSDADATRVNKDGLVETTVANQARLNYDFIDGVVQPDPHLLLEPTRTNLLPYSQDFTNWGDTGVTVTSNAAIAPDGTQTADKLVSTTNNWRRNKAFTSVDGFTYTFSVFVKLDTSTTTTTTQIEIYKGATGFAVDFDLQNQTISGSGFSDSFIEKYPNGWFRIGGTYQANGTTNIVYVYPSSGFGIVGTMFFWGAQAEVGFQKTSYIPTAGSAVTRTEDFCNIPSGLGNVLNTSEGTLFVDVEVPRVPTTSDFERIVLSDQNSGTDRLIFDDFGGNWRVLLLSTAGNVNKIIVSVTANQRIKVAIAYSSTGLRISYDGNTATTTSGSYTPTTTLESFKFSNKDGGNKWQGKIYQAMYFNTALTDSELQTLTT